MANTKKKSYDMGVSPLSNGNWAYRFKISVDGEIVAQRRSKDIYGMPYTTKKAAIDVRKTAIKAAKAKEPIEAIPISEPKTVKEDKLCVNKDTKIHMPRTKVEERLDIVAYTREECAVIDEQFKGTNAETAYLLGRFCGLRINECFGLKWDCVDLENGTIRIERQMQYQDGVIKLVTLKTKNAYRTIYLNERMKQHLTALWERRKEDEVVLRYQRQQNQIMIEDVDGTKVSSLELVNTLPNGHIQTGIL